VLLVKVIIGLADAKAVESTSTAPKAENFEQMFINPPENSAKCGPFSLKHK
jgi:hypothetical protein